MLDNISRVRIDRERFSLLIANLFILVIFSPYFYFGESIYARVFDNMDSNIVWIKMALESGNLFTLKGSIDQMMCQLPTHSVYGSFDISLILFGLLGSFWGYVVAKILMAYIAFWGMFLLLNKHMIPPSKKPFISLMIVSISLLFSLLPFWSFALHVAGLPLVFYALLNLRNGDKRVFNWIILLVFAFWSSLVLVGYVVLLIFSFIWLYDFFVIKKRHSYLFFGLVVLTLFYVLSHLPLFYAHFNPSYISVRTEFDKSATLSLKTALKEFILPLFLYGDVNQSRHSVSMHYFSIIPILIALLLMLKNKVLNKTFIFLLIFVIFSSLYYGINEAAFFNNIRQFLWSVFPISLIRIYWLNAFFWYMLFAISLYFLSKHLKYGVHLSVLFLFLQLMVLIPQQDYMFYRKTERMRFKNFYAVEQFQDIAKCINKDQSTYRIVNIGLEPMISLYNGFYTVDGFSVDYPLSYKHEFREVIAEELDLTPPLRNLYDKWGGRCYLFIKEAYPTTHPYREKIDRKLLLNYDKLKQLGAEYIVSANEINEVLNGDIELVKIFNKEEYTDSFWTIYLYKLL